jgi:HK97 gp10 family phage protein
MSLSMDIEINDNTDKIKEIAQQQLAVALEAVGLQAEGDVKRTMARYSPKPIVDTGRLMNSITHSVDESDNTAVVGTNVEYAPYVEYGTSKTKAKPFLKPTIQENLPQYKEIFEDYMKGND